MRTVPFDLNRIRLRLEGSCRQWRTSRSNDAVGAREEASKEGVAPHQTLSKSQTGKNKSPGLQYEYDCTQ